MYEQKISHVSSRQRVEDVMIQSVQMVAPGIARLRSKACPPLHVARHHGLIAGTHVATENGWQPVESLTPGDRLLTRDRDFQTLRLVRHRPLWPDVVALPRRQWPVRVPAGAHGNARALEFLPDQALILEKGPGEGFAGEADREVPASALIGALGVHSVPPRPHLTLYGLIFGDDQVVYVDGGLQVPCPRHSTGRPDIAVFQTALHLAA
jgi:hypothetical protein